jgi:hypothetical protein
MSKEYYYTEYTSDGCPNNCKYCHDLGIPCVYTDEGGRNICAVCGKRICDSNTYEYKDYMFCEDCFDVGKEKVNYKISQAVESINARSVGIGDPYFFESALKENPTFRNAVEVAGKESQFEKDLRNGVL